MHGKVDKQNTRCILKSQNGLCFKITTDSTRTWCMDTSEFLATNNNNGHAIVMKMSPLMMYVLKTKVYVSNHHVICRHLLHVFS